MQIKYKANILFFLLAQLFFQNVYAQPGVNEKVLKLWHTVDTVKGDSAKCKYTLSLVRTYIGFDLKKADSVLNIAFKYRNGKGCDHCELWAMEYKAQIYWLNSEYHQSLQELIKMQQIAGEKKIIDSYVTCNSNIGAIYFEMGNKEEAKKYFENAVRIGAENIKGYPGLKNNIITALLNLSQIDTGTAVRLTLLNKAKDILDTIKVKNNDYNINLQAYYRYAAGIYSAQKFYAKSLYNARLAYHYSMLADDKSLSAFNMLDMANAHQKSGSLDSSKVYLDKAYLILKDLGIKSRLKHYFNILAEYYALRKDFEKAYNANAKFHELSEEVTNEDIRNKTSLLNITYQTAKKEEENTRLKSENLTQELQIERTSAQRNMFVAGGAGILILSLFLFYNFHQQKKNAKLLRDKNDTISQQHNILFEQKKEITDSIEYALKLQKNLLPEFFNESITKQNSFLIYKPKNIVSGDFYYVHSSLDYSLYLVGDCTGHGVPGAILSVIALEKCKELCEQKLGPANFIKELNNHIVALLGKKNNKEAVNDGMEISCVVFANNTWVYAGANRPLFIIYKNEFTEVKGDKCSISANNKSGLAFTENILTPAPQSRIFLLSDGLADQFGGLKDKKLTSKRLKDWLTETSVLPPDEQRKELEARLKNWQNNFQQTDDITLMGINIS